ncbi:hypothetical protein HG531_010964 [Fusarium graminearum]|nr:hypothetical protein HG531_010964 [Fusarium graminearum]
MVEFTAGAARPSALFSVLHQGPGHVETGASSRAVVVDVVDGDLGHAELVEDALAAGAVTVAVTRDALVHIIVVDLRVEKGLDACFEAQFCVVNFAAGFDELGHAHAQDVDG